MIITSNQLQTPVWHPFSKHNWQYLWFRKTPLFCTFLPIHLSNDFLYHFPQWFYPSTWQVGRSLHKAMTECGFESWHPHQTVLLCLLTTLPHMLHTPWKKYFTFAWGVQDVMYHEPQDFHQLTKRTLCMKSDDACSSFHVCFIFARCFCQSSPRKHGKKVTPNC